MGIFNVLEVGGGGGEYKGERTSGEVSGPESQI